MLSETIYDEEPTIESILQTDLFASAIGSQILVTAVCRTSQHHQYATVFGVFAVRMFKPQCEGIIQPVGAQNSPSFE